MNTCSYCKTLYIPKRKTSRYCSRFCSGQTRKLIPLYERLRKKFTKNENGCLIWTGATTHAGYGLLNIGGNPPTLVYTHRLSYELYYGPIPFGAYILHQCDQPACCNPLHLSWGTQFDNMTDMTNKNRRAFIKLDKNTVQQIRKRFAEGGITRKSLADEYGVSGTMIGKIISNIAWKLPDATP